MKAYVVQGLIGVFAFNEKGESIDQVFFPKDAKKNSPQYNSTPNN